MAEKTNCAAALNIAGEHYPCQEPAPHDGWAHANRDAEAIWASDKDPIPGMPAWDEYERMVLVPIREGRHIVSDRFDCWCEPRTVHVPTTPTTAADESGAGCGFPGCDNQTCLPRCSFHTVTDIDFGDESGAGA